jgi:two-component system, NtrC family, sensor kinase
MPGVVTTIGDRCKRCYHCVRHCPARAIRVVEGQATVVEERCIACGNCLRVCAQHAKAIESGVATVQEFLAQGGEVVAALAPSFPAAFPQWRPRQLVAAMRKLGFSRVVEVAFGADLAARRYRKLVGENGGKHLLASPCPALVTYIEKYAPSLVPVLAPIVSPMIALGRALRQKHWPDCRIVFMGPCIAKKNEMRDPEVADVIDAVLTFDEVHELLAAAGVDPAQEADSDFDGPRAALGRVFPVSGGLLRTAVVEQDVLDSDILVTDGMLRVQRLLDEMQKGEFRAHFVDLLFCEGCINGPVMPGDLGEFARRDLVTSYVKSEPRMGPEEAEAFLAQYDDVDLTRGYRAQPVEPPLPSEEEIKAVLARVNKFNHDDELNCGACGYPTCREKAIAVCQGLAEVEMCLPYLIDEAQKALAEITHSHAVLASTQERLMQAEKLAAVGQLAAGVAHQVNNPLATVLLYSHLMLRQLPAGDPRREDLETIVAEADRCKGIMVALLDFARESRLNLSSFDLNELLEGVLETGRRKYEGINFVGQFAPDLGAITADADQLTQVFKNLKENACEAMGEGGTLTVATARENGEVRIEFLDTGPGIDASILPRIFDPFFTTKPMGQGTGLGLAIVKGIVKMHRGEVTADNRPEGGARFTVSLPRQAAAEGGPEVQETIG